MARALVHRPGVVLIGVPRRVIGAAYLAQFALPLIGALILGSGLGLAGYETYRAIDDLAQETVAGFYLSSMFWWLTVALVVGVLVTSSLSLLAARGRMRPDAAGVPAGGVRVETSESDTGHADRLSAALRP